MQSVILSVDGMSCGHCVASVRRAVEAVPGVTVRDVRVGRAELGLDATVGPDAVIEAVRDAGYDAAVVATAEG